MNTHQPPSLLLSKLRPPLNARFQVRRAAVVDRIADDRDSRLVLIRAPAGFGKTTVMQQARDACEARQVATAWLTVDPADNDVNRFLAFLSAALDRIAAVGDGQREPAVAHLQLRDEASGELALELMDRVASCTVPFSLFIDEFESVQNSTVLGLVRELVDHVPAGSQLILGSRSVPELGFGRLRARGLLLEIEPADLRFSIDEATHFLRDHRGLSLDGNQIARLHETTEGWAAALWLASMAVERRADAGAFLEGFSGSSAAIADYLAEDVFANLPEALQTFLLRTSVLHQLNGSLCNAVAGVEDGDALLEELERRNLFLLPLSDDRSWYRYHSLFRDFLRSLLARQRPGEVAALHRAAADWYRRQGRPIPAVEHALASDESDTAVAILLDNAEQLLIEGRFRLLSRWLGALPSDALDAHPRLRVVHVWALAFSRGYKEGMGILARMDDGEMDAETRAHVLSVRPMLLTMMDHVEQAYDEAMVNLQKLEAGVNFPYSMLANSAAYLAMIKGHYGESRQLLEASRLAQDGGTGRFNMIYSEVVEATIDLLRGRLRQATQRFRVAAGTQHGHRRFDTNGNVMAGVPLAEVLYETNALDQAERLLNVYVPLVRGVRLPDQMISAHVTMSRIAALRGDTESAFQLLTDLEYLGYEGQLPRVVSSARLERLRHCLIQGDLHGARNEYLRARDRELWARVTPYSALGNDIETLALARLRLLAHGPRPERAVAPLRHAVSETERNRRHRRALKLRLLLAAALARSGDHEQAMVELEPAMRFAADEGFVRIIADEGDVVIGPVRAFTTSRAGANLPADYRERLYAACGVGDDTAAGGCAAGAMPEPLTPKEVRVLEQLAAGNSNSGIAAMLFVSESTVRTHLRNINAKLDARNRTEAVAIARRLGLVD